MKNMFAVLAVMSMFAVPAVAGSGAGGGEGGEAKIFVGDCVNYSGNWQGAPATKCTYLDSSTRGQSKEDRAKN